MRAQLPRKASLLIGAALLAAPGQAMAAEPVAETGIDEIVMYAVESSSPARLMRYFFLSDTFVAIGEVWTTEGYAVDDVEALSYVPQGPYKGLYGVATKGATEQHLTRIDPLTAQAFEYPSSLGGSDITGMIADFDEGSGEWYLLASDKGGKMRRVDPATGNAAVLCTVGHDFEGLARNSEGILFGNTRTHLYRLDLVLGEEGMGDHYDPVMIGPTGLDKAESLEFAFGNNAPPITMPGVGEGWTQHGVLFVFDDDTDKFGILNPTSGQFKEYLVDGAPCTFSNQDAEGMIFVTTINDPLYGSIDGFD